VTVETTSDTPVEIQLPFSVNNETTVTIAVQPNFGSVLVPINGSVIYTPFKGSTGQDSFIVQVCDRDLTCEVLTLRVTVQPKSSTDSSFNPLYCLALLGLLPIGALALVLCKSRGRNAQQLLPKTAQPPVPGTPSTTMDPTSQANAPLSLKHDNDDTHVEEDQLDALPEETSDDSDCYTSGLTVDEGSFNEVHVVAASRVSTLTNKPAVHRPNEAAHLPQHKDQCRSVPLGDRPLAIVHDPIANAILIRDDDDNENPAIMPHANHAEA
jgi:Bacterial Ig domain